MAADKMTEKMSQSGADVGIDPPKKGDSFRCSSCGMEIQVTSDCGCQDKGHVHFHCCGKELQKA